MGWNPITFLRKLAAKAEAAEAPPTPPEYNTPSRQLKRAKQAPSIYLLVNGEQRGPFPRADVEIMLQLKNLPDKALFWQEGLQDWKPISEFSKLHG